MKASFWLRALALVLALFTLGHTIGNIPRITRGEQEASVVAAMQGFRFPIMGFTRSYWDFYQGFSLTITALLAVLMLIAWQAAGIADKSYQSALPFAVSLLVACAALGVISWHYFFAGPVIASCLAIGCATAAVISLRS